MNQHISNPDTFIKADLPLINQHNLSHAHRHHLRLHRMPSGSEEEGDDELDPRIQVELEKLNRASEDINRLEMELDDARTAFRQVLSESTQCLNALSRRLGSCVEKARPYYDARLRLREAHLESQKAVLRFERSRRMHEAAREMVQLAEEGYKRREKDLDPTWQEMLNHATLKVNDAEKETLESEQNHHAITLVFKRKEEEVHRLQKDLKKVITKSRPYFDMKEKFHQLLENHKRCVSRLENEVGSAKSLYSQTLHNLEAISDSIHQHRLEQRLKLQLGVREAGVGAEAPAPSPTCSKGMTVEGSLSSHGIYSEVDTDSIDSGQTFTNSKTRGDISQSTRSVSTLSCDPVYDINVCTHDASLKDGDIKGSELNAAELNAISSGLPRVPCMCRFPHKCLPNLNCQLASRNCACPDVLELSNFPIEGLAEGAASNDAGEGCCSVSQATGNLSKAYGCQNVVCQQLPISKSPEMSSSMSQSLKQDPELGFSRENQEHKSLSSKDIAVPSRSLPMSLCHPSKLSSPSEDLSVASHNCSLLSLSIQDLSKLPSQTPSQLSSELTAGTIHGRIIRDALLPSLVQDRATPATSSEPFHQTQPPLPQTQPPLPQTQPPLPQTQPPLPQTQPPLPQTQPPLPQTQPHLHQIPPPPTDITAVSSPADPSIRINRSQSLPISSTAGRSASSQYNITCMGSPLEECTSLPGSSANHTKTSKLQGVILQVDTASILSDRPSVHPSADLEKGPKVIISTHHPTLGVFIETPSQSHYSESL
ncbi:unnamed protein product [Candidula unifasciata]|uniref:SH3 domain-binding protein 5-like n=1 Tax=Candidula unifasciata TaxID=100452 RepID=A0A8S3YZA2_9EUPU|nr:unnamed protein product [Candidula unifasciata]